MLNISEKRVHLIIISGIILIILLGTVVFGSWQYYQSKKIKKQVDLLVKENDPEDAIILYDHAHIYLFFKRGLTASYKQAQQLLQFDLAAENKNSNVDMTKDYQVEPSLPSSPPQKTPTPTIPPPTLAPQITPTPTPLQIPQNVTVPILMYHHIEINPRPRDPIWAALYVAPDTLNGQLAFLSSHNFHAITFDDLYNALMGKSVLPVNPILLTFDDGWQSFYNGGFPLLKKYDMKSTAFVITDYCNQKYPAYLSWDQIKEMSASGLVDVEDHTRNHPFLTRLSDVSLTSELTESKDAIETHVQKPAHWFAYPYGNYNIRVAKAVQEAGFFGAVTTNYGATETLGNIYTMPRIMVDGRFTTDDFAKRIQSLQ